MTARGTSSRAFQIRMQGYKTLAPGQTVEFGWNRHEQEESGRWAVGVTPLDNAA